MEVTRRDIFVHAYISQGYDPDAAIEMADGLIALLAQSKALLEPVEEPQEWSFHIAPDIHYYVDKGKFNNTWDVRQHGVDLSLVGDRLRLRSKGVGNPYVDVVSYGKVDNQHNLDIFVFDVIIPNRGVWFGYNEDYVVGMNFEDGVIERIDQNFHDLLQSEERMTVSKGDRLIFEVSRDHRHVRVHCQNWTTRAECYMEFTDNDIIKEDSDTLIIGFSEGVITEIEIAYLAFGLKKVQCCEAYEFTAFKDLHWEEREWFDSEEFKTAYTTLARNNTHIAYREKCMV